MNSSGREDAMHKSLESSQTLAAESKHKDPLAAADGEDDDDEIPFVLIAPASVLQNDVDCASDLVERRPVPLTLLCGYLGAGKSTLVNHILSSADHGLRIAVVLNEFADTTDFESNALRLSATDAGNDVPEILELPNGCLCCSVRDTGAAAIQELLKRKDYDYVLLETTGLADPTGLAEMFWQNEDMNDQLVLDGIVCVVDAKNVLEQLSNDGEAKEINECARQIGAADIILLNKVDLITSERHDKIAQAIRDINILAPVIETTRALVAIDRILNIGAFNPNRLIQSHAAGMIEGSPKAEEKSCSKATPDIAKHLTDITSVIVPLAPLKESALTRLSTFLDALLFERRVISAADEDSKPSSTIILRTKGVVSVIDDFGKFLTLRSVQGVRDIHECRVIPSGPDDKPRDGKIVFIGKNMPLGLANAFLEYVYGNGA